jgi:hypothetical protein
MAEGPSRRRAALWLALAGLVALVVFALGEAMVRIATPRLLDDDLPLILGSPALRADELGAVRYQPHAQVRYAFSTVHGLEYDVRFRTNNLGYVDERDYPLPAPGPRVIAFAGDSYAVGAEGGEPWVPRLREASGATLYSLGTPATGVVHFERALRGFRRVAAMPEIVIVAISDDFYRPPWRPLADADGVRMCAPGSADAQCTRQLLHAVGLAPSSSEVQRAAAQLRRRLVPTPSPLRALVRRSALLRFLARLPAAWASRAGRSQAFDENVAALRAIRSQFPTAKIRFVQVPDKHESAAARYTLDVSKLLEGTGIAYFSVLASCPLSPEHYFARDNHPNAAGYRRLSACVAAYLGL